MLGPGFELVDAQGITIPGWVKTADWSTAILKARHA
jgi:hypothetical protein